ncbi:Uncharacterized conserved protein [Marivita hallyeonensis]|uniref:Uncharacterized conserved protein n=1 Tax=Marivita hallyeonensis TaxID=996342 RepID=A0A1M5TS89_9RHOB|nr:Uncharacterized conserved protein [Marivita hallyeonensis]
MALKTGQCLCGAVSFRGDVDETAQACHCTQCQRWTGGGPLFAVRVRDLELTGEDHIRTYNHSDWGDRAVCETCGSTLYWKLTGRSVAFVALGLVDDQSDVTITEEIFVDYRPAWLSPFEGATQRTEAEMKAQLAAFLEKEKRHDQV